MSNFFSCVIVASLFAMTLVCSPSFATPPVSISLSYDLAGGSLHVDALHPTTTLNKSYVRLMNVYVNDTQVSTWNYTRQNDYDKFVDDVQITAKIGDTIKVDLFCAEGGELAQELKVKKPDAPKAED
jgi:hypothetical protein